MKAVSPVSEPFFEPKFDVAPLRFQAQGKEMMFVHADTKHELAGWILYRHPDGQWVTLRKATSADIAEMSAAVSAAHHRGRR
jgi:hypothetical protein